MARAEGVIVGHEIVKSHIVEMTTVSIEELGIAWGELVVDCEDFGEIIFDCGLIELVERGFTDGIAKLAKSLISCQSSVECGGGLPVSEIGEFVVEFEVSCFEMRG